MPIPTVIVGGSPKSKGPAVDVPQDIGWPAIRTVSVLLMAVGIVDLILAFIPFQAARPVWLFGVIGGVVGGLPLPSLGLIGGLTASFAGGSRRSVRVFGALNALFALAILGCLTVFLSVMSEARAQTVQDLLPQFSKLAVRTVLISGLFAALHGYCGLIGLQRGRHQPQH